MIDVTDFEMEEVIGKYFRLSLVGRWDDSYQNRKLTDHLIKPFKVVAIDDTEVITIAFDDPEDQNRYEIARSNYGHTYIFDYCDIQDGVFVEVVNANDASAFVAQIDALFKNGYTMEIRNGRQTLMLDSLDELKQAASDIYVDTFRAQLNALDAEHERAVKALKVKYGM
ncbi:hypothetical protein MYO4S_00014 [Serratia phage 4S]|nr:hypothetical protein MYO4S_00014 [Serratia phage 4S]